LSNNNLKEINGLNVLTHLLTLKLDFNKLTSVKLDPLPYLQHASFTNNRIKSCEGIAHPKLEVLNLNSKYIFYNVFLKKFQNNKFQF
jgi:Leucine-rich repeat (LRR) protein